MSNKKKKKYKKRNKKKNYVSSGKLLLVLFLTLIVILFDVFLIKDAKKNSIKNDNDVEQKEDNSKKEKETKKTSKNQTDYFEKMKKEKGYNSKKDSSYKKLAERIKTKNYSYDFVYVINDKYFMQSKFDRYYKYFKNNKDLKARSIVENVNCNLDYDYYTTDYSTDLSKENLLITNKYYKLGENYVPDNLVTVEKEYGNSLMFNKTAYEAFKILHDDAKEEGLSVIIVSAYRSYDYQKKLYNNYVKMDGKKEADRYSARPGYSEHQTGLAIDVTSKGVAYTNFKSTKEYTWMKQNSWKYGFILRYSEEKEAQTGYMFEAWHYRYLGKETAKKVFNSGLTYDEYYEFYIK